VQDFAMGAAVALAAAGADIILLLTGNVSID
jgi:hypothetical protein